MGYYNTLSHCEQSAHPEDRVPSYEGDASLPVDVPERKPYVSPWPDAAPITDDAVLSAVLMPTSDPFAGIGDEDASRVWNLAAETETMSSEPDEPHQIERYMAINALMAYIKSALADPGADYDRERYKIGEMLFKNVPLRHWPDWMFDCDDVTGVALYLKGKYPPPVQS